MELLKNRLKFILPLSSPHSFSNSPPVPFPLHSCTVLPPAVPLPAPEVLEDGGAFRFFLRFFGANIWMVVWVVIFSCADGVPPWLLKYKLSVICCTEFVPVRFEFVAIYFLIPAPLLKHLNICPDMLLLTWCGCNYSTDSATATRQGGMVAASLVDSCCLGLENQECGTGYRLCM